MTGSCKGSISHAKKKIRHAETKTARIKNSSLENTLQILHVNGSNREMLEQWFPLYSLKCQLRSRSFFRFKFLFSVLKSRHIIYFNIVNTKSMRWNNRKIICWKSLDVNLFQLRRNIAIACVASVSAKHQKSRSLLPNPTETLAT